jgi:diguanylate cyclase (GGDEF)-like protein
MSARLKPALLGGAGFTFAGVSALTLLTSLFLLFHYSLNVSGVLPALALAFVAGSIALYQHASRLSEREHRHRVDEENSAQETKVLRQEFAFYEQRKKEMAGHAAQRRFLSESARELGSSLDPGVIQTKLLEAAQRLFAGRPSSLSNGQNMDNVDTWIIQKRQPLLVPSESIKGNPLIAAPVMIQREVAAILRVGGTPGPAFTREDLRLLDILAGLASMALGNLALFTQVQETALRDGLTGLLTHRAFQDHLQSAVLEASRYNQPVSILLSDVDHFKKVNDSFGHQAGDQILQGFAHVLDRNVRAGVDIISRYGGEEFVVLLYQMGHAEALEVAERIRQDLASLEFDVGGHPLSITTSLGVATFPEDATSAQQLLRQADQRLYRAKQAGRNRVQGR